MKSRRSAGTLRQRRRRSALTLPASRRLMRDADAASNRDLRHDARHIAVVLR